MIEKIIKRSGKNPIAALLHQKGAELYFPEATGETWKLHELATSIDIAFLKENEIPFVDAKDVGLIPTDTLQRMLSFTPLEVASTELAGTDGKGYVCEWLSLADFIGANTYWADKEPQPFVIEVYDPVVVTGLNAFQSIPFIKAKPQRAGKQMGILARADDVINARASVTASADGRPFTNGNREALSTLKRILNREKTLVSLGVKNDNDGIRSFVSQGAVLCASGRDREFTDTVRVSVNAVKKAISLTNDRYMGMR